MGSACCGNSTLFLERKRLLCMTRLTTMEVCCRNQQNNNLIKTHSRDRRSQPQPRSRSKSRLQTLEAGSPSVAIRIQYKGTERTTELPLTLDVVARLAWEAEFRDMRIGEFIGELISGNGDKGPFSSGAREALIRGGLSYGASESEATAQHERRRPPAVGRSPKGASACARLSKEKSPPAGARAMTVTPKVWPKWPIFPV